VFTTYQAVAVNDAAPVVVRNNVFYGSGLNVGVVVSAASTVELENNTFVSVAGWGIYVVSATTSTRLYGRNNIFAFDTIGVTDNPGFDPSHQHWFGLFNDYWSNTNGNFSPASNTTLKLEGGDLTQDPLFVNRAAADYHLQSSSPAVNSGHPDARYNDVDGSRNDRGAYGGPRLNTATIADFIISPTTGGADTVFTLDASPSADRESESSALLVRWDYDNDGVYDTDLSTQKTAQIQFKDLGAHTVKLEVRDEGGFVIQRDEEPYSRQSAAQFARIDFTESKRVAIDGDGCVGDAAQRRAELDWR